MMGLLYVSDFSICSSFLLGKTWRSHSFVLNGSFGPTSCVAHPIVRWFTVIARYHRDLAKEPRTLVHVGRRIPSRGIGAVRTPNYNEHVSALVVVGVHATSSRTWEWKTNNCDGKIKDVL